MAEDEEKKQRRREEVFPRKVCDDERKILKNRGQLYLSRDVLVKNTYTKHYNSYSFFNYN